MIVAIGDAPINRLPAGLLSALDIKSMGQNPRKLNEQVFPHIDLWQFYLQSAARRYNLTVAGNIIATGVTGFYAYTGDAMGVLPTNTGVVTVPMDEVWYVTSSHTQMSFGAGAGEFGDFVTGVLPNPGTYFTAPGQSMGFLGQKGSVAGYAAVGVSYCNGYWMRAGDVPGAYIAYMVLGANRPWSGSYDIARFKV